MPMESAEATKKAKAKSTPVPPKKKSKKQKKKAQPGSPTMAERADRFELYERAVQDCPSDIDFLLQAWRELFGDRDHPLHFREDFCGSAAMCAEWVGRHPEATAEGFDIDSECLEWGRVHHIAPLGDDEQRVVLHQKDVREAGDRPADIRCAHNFSYQIFRERQELKDYFVATRSELTERGIFVIDLFGGSEAVEELEEERDIDDGAFTYIWEQRSFHPASGKTDCFIHFRLPDGSKIDEAFSYTWRLYTPPELRDLLHDAGFSEVRIYFEEFDDDGDGTGIFVRDDEGPACEGWLGYMVAIP